MESEFDDKLKRSSKKSIEKSDPSNEVPVFSSFGKDNLKSSEKLKNKESEIINKNSKVEKNESEKED